MGEHSPTNDRLQCKQHQWCSWLVFRNAVEYKNANYLWSICQNNNCSTEWFKFIKYAMCVQLNFLGLRKLLFLSSIDLQTKIDNVVYGWFLKPLRYYFNNTPGEESTDCSCLIQFSSRTTPVTSLNSEQRYILLYNYLS